MVASVAHFEHDVVAAKFSPNVTCLLVCVHARKLPTVAAESRTKIASKTPDPAERPPAQYSRGK